jgi:GGDEF domain-containing protein
VLLNEIADPQTIGSICEKLLTAFGRPFELGGLNVHVSISIGASIYPTDGQDSKTLMIASNPPCTAPRPMAATCTNTTRVK